MNNCLRIKIIPSTGCVVVSIFPFHTGGFGGSSVQVHVFFSLIFFLVITLENE